MNKIGSKELFAICLSIFGCLFRTFGSFKILNLANNSTLITSIIGFSLGFIILLIILYIFNKQDNLNFFEYNIKHFKIFGYIINIIFFLLITIVFFIISWSIIKFTVDELLIRTSHYIVAFFFFIVVAYAASKGIEVILRTGLILLYIYVFILIFNISFLVPEVSLSNILPIEFKFSSNILLCILEIITCAIIPFTSILCIRKNTIVDKEKANKKIILAYLIVAFTLILCLIMIIGTYGMDIAKILTYPEYYIFKKIDAFHVVQRIENLSAFIIFICHFSTLSILVYFIRMFFQNTFNIKKQRDTTIICYVVSLVIPFLSIFIFKNLNILVLFNYYPYISIPIITIICIEAILVSFIKKDS